MNHINNMDLQVNPVIKQEPCDAEEEIFEELNAQGEETNDTSTSLSDSSEALGEAFVEYKPNKQEDSDFICMKISLSDMYNTPPQWQDEQKTRVKEEKKPNQTPATDLDSSPQEKCVITNSGGPQANSVCKSLYNVNSASTSASCSTSAVSEKRSWNKCQALTCKQEIAPTLESATSASSSITGLNPPDTHGKFGPECLEDIECDTDTVSYDSRTLDLHKNTKSGDVVGDMPYQCTSPAKPKRKQSTYLVSFKLEVVEFAEKYGNRSAEREFSIDEKNVRHWRKIKSTLMKSPQCPAKFSEKREFDDEERPRIENKPDHWKLHMQSSKKNLNRYEASFKLEVVQFAEKHGNRAAQRKYSISERSVRDWRKMKDTNFESKSPESKCRKKRVKTEVNIPSNLDLENSFGGEKGLERKGLVRKISFETSFKLKVIEYAEEHGNRAAEREFLINEASVRLWRKMKDSLLEKQQCPAKFAEKGEFDSKETTQTEGQSDQCKSNVKLLKRKLNSYESSFKLKVAQFAEKHGNRAAEREFSISERSVRDWRKMKDAISYSKESESEGTNKRASMSPILELEEFEEDVYLWILDKCANGGPVSRNAVGGYVHQLINEQKYKLQGSFNDIWCVGFLEKKGLHLQKD